MPSTAALLIQARDIEEAEYERYIYEVIGGYTGCCPPCGLSGDAGRERCYPEGLRADDREGCRDRCNETAGETLAQRLGVPERFTANESYTDGRLTLTANAEIVLPDVAALPTMRVEPENFSQELVNGLYDYLVGDIPMYQQQMKYIKEQVQENIVMWQKTLNDPNSSEESKDRAKKEISNLEGLYNSASEKADMIAADSEIKLQTEYDFTTGKKISEYIGVNIAEKPGLNAQGGKTFMIRNNTKGGEITVEEDEFGALVTDTASQGARFLLLQLRFRVGRSWHYIAGGNGNVG